MRRSREAKDIVVDFVRCCRVQIEGSGFDGLIGEAMFRVLQRARGSLGSREGRGEYED